MHTVLHDLGANLLAGMRLALWLPLQPQAFRVGAGAFVALACFNVVVWLLADIALVGWLGELQPTALEAYLAQMALVLLAALVIAGIYDDPQLRLRLAVMWLASSWLFELVATTLTTTSIVEGASGAIWPSWLVSIDQVYWIWMSAAAFRVVALVAPWRRWRFIPAAAVAGVLVALLNGYVARPELWRDLPAPALVRTPGIEQEATFHAQASLLDQTLARINPGRAGVVDLYFLGVAAYGAQDVFLREVRAVQALFDERFDTAGRSAALINNNATLADTPIASLTNLRMALRTLGTRMNRDEDVLFLLLTTHGDEAHRLEVELWPLVLDPITPPAIEQALKASGIKWKVLVISACYSGGFVEALRDPYTVVITAADARSSSFGCAHENDWTYFGEAYFNEALRKTRSFIDAFELARHRVAAREQAERLVPSNPQIVVGDAVRERLQALQLRLERGR